MYSGYSNQLCEDLQNRVSRIAHELTHNGIDAMLVHDNAGLYYVSGRVYAGYALIMATGTVRHFVRRPVGLQDVDYIRKPEQIVELLGSCPAKLALQWDSLSVADFNRLSHAFEGATIVDGSAIMRKVRSVKSQLEVEGMRWCGVKHVNAYSHIPEVYRAGMTDVELQIEIERLLRLNGCLGLFRVHGESMELFMGNILCGDNADNPSPYDFAMGGAGQDLSIPVGANGTEIKPGHAIMVDACGNFNGYMTDMTRTFSVGELPELAMRAHQVSIEINHCLAREGRPGVEARHLYELALKMACQAGLEQYYMGHQQKAGFVGHGVGIEVNEAPVLAPRSRDILEFGNVIAIEPKFVIPGVGAVGIENTYVVTADGMECITLAPEVMLPLDK